MKPAERNKLLRELANEIAAKVAPVIGVARAPKCHRITKTRGRGNQYQFSVPAWAAAPTAPTEYFLYYVAHEVCHAVAFNHGPEFRAAECKALESLGLRPIYTGNGAGPYVSALADLAGNLVCVRPPGKPGAKWRELPRKPAPGEGALP
jgi:hypothetical protein